MPLRLSLYSLRRRRFQARLSLTDEIERHPQIRERLCHSSRSTATWAEMISCTWGDNCRPKGGISISIAQGRPSRRRSWSPSRTGFGNDLLQYCDHGVRITKVRSIPPVPPS